MTASEVKEELQKYASKEHALLLQKYFKTGKGQYAEGDIFLGLTVPQIRKVAKSFRKLSFSEIEKLLRSKIHECRLTSLLILVDRYSNNDINEKEEIFNFYLQNTYYINNWDLVDLSAPRIIGEWLIAKEPKEAFKQLERLANSKNLWERRIAIISTLSFIKKERTDETLKLAKILLGDKHDLIHKAVGWALREVGKIDQKFLVLFLKNNYAEIPRTTLRYAIEKFPEGLRLQYLYGNFTEV